jgi:hypothetical protein
VLEATSWQYEDGEVPDLDVLVEAARSL